MAKKGLTAKQQIFVAEYLIGKNATRAYRKAYPTCRSDNAAGVEGLKALKKPMIKAAIEEGLKKQQVRCEITADRVVKEIARLAFFDFRKLFDENWRLKPLSELDDDTAAAIGGIDISQTAITKLKIWDKNAALEKLAKHFGIFEADNKQKEGNVHIHMDCTTK